MNISNFWLIWSTASTSVWMVKNLYWPTHIVESRHPTLIGNHLCLLLTGLRLIRNVAWSSLSRIKLKFSRHLSFGIINVCLVCSVICSCRFGFGQALASFMHFSIAKEHRFNRMRDLGFCVHSLKPCFSFSRKFCFTLSSMELSVLLPSWAF